MKNLYHGFYTQYYSIALLSDIVVTNSFMQLLLYLISDKYEVNITDLIQQHVGNNLYTTILDKYATVPE